MTELERSLQIEVAAQDRDFVAFYQQRTIGYATGIPLERAEDLEAYTQEQMDAETMRLYGLNEEELTRARTLCIEGITKASIDKKAS